MTGPAEYRATFTSTTGGVMTEEAGAITGDLELLCRPAAEGTHVAVRYAGTSDWYTVAGSPVPALGEGGETRDRMLEHLTTPGPVVSGNERPVTLEGPAGE
jgi:hypothetical protein